MKIFYSTLITFCFTLSGIAQPVISNIEPDIGDQFLYTRADNTNYTPGEAGTAMYWDYSDLYAQALNDLNYTILAPSEGEEHESFPNATSVWYKDVQIESAMHVYKSFENNRMTDHGFYVVNSTLSSYGHKYYSDPESTLTFPMAYNDTDSDTYSGHYESVFWGTERAFVGTTSYVVDGYGTVETQYAVFEDVLRVRITEVEQVMDIFNENHNTRYTSRTEWYSNEFPVPVLTTITSYEVENEGTGFEETGDTLFVVAALATYNNVATALEKSPLPNAFQIFPNPAKDYLTVDIALPEDGILKIFSSDGRLVHEGQVKSSQSVDISDLLPGLYIADLEVKNQCYLPVSFVVR